MTINLKDMPGIKEDELLKLGSCRICQKPIGTDLTFYRVRVERAGLDVSAMERRIGLRMMLGGSDTLAQAMGPNEDLAKVFDGPHECVVHEHCAHRLSLLQLIPEDESQ